MPWLFLFYVDLMIFESWKYVTKIIYSKIRLLSHQKSNKFKFSTSQHANLIQNLKFQHFFPPSTPSLSNIRLMLMLHIQLDLIFISLFSIISDFILCARDHRVSMHVFTERVSALMAISHDGDLLALSLDGRVRTRLCVD